MIKTFVCVHDFSFVKDMIEQLNGKSGVDLIGFTTELPKDISGFHTMDADVLVLDCTQKVTEALALSEQIRMDENLHFRIIYLFKEFDTNVLDYVFKHEADSSFIHAPFTIGKLILAITQKGNEAFKAEHLHSSQEGYTSQVMQSFGLPVHLKGYSYIKTAVMLLYHSKGVSQMPMKQVYKEIARIYETTSSRVEKAMRNAIDYAFRITPNQIHIQGIKPTNSQLIHTVCEHVILHETKERG